VQKVHLSSAQEEPVAGLQKDFPFIRLDKCGSGH